MGEKMKVRFEKEWINEDLLETEELHFVMPSCVLKELGWEDGTIVEWIPGKIETIDGLVQHKIVLKNIDDKILGDLEDE